MSDDAADRFAPPTEDDLHRVRSVLQGIGGKNVSWGAREVLEVLLVERRMWADRLASERLIRATWVLTGATIVLAVATTVLIFATLAD